MPRGRKGKYEYWLTEDGLALLRGWARNGLTDEEIAREKIGISRTTLSEWKNKFPYISDALKKGKDIYDSKAEDALHNKAIGCTVTEEIWEAAFDKETGRNILDEETGEPVMLLVRRTVKEIPPDTTALIFWLKNRLPKRWRDRRDVNMEAEIKGQNPFTELTTDELRKLIRDG